MSNGKKFVIGFEIKANDGDSTKVIRRNSRELGGLADQADQAAAAQLGMGKASNSAKTGLYSAAAAAKEYRKELAGYSAAQDRAAQAASHHYKQSGLLNRQFAAQSVALKVGAGEWSLWGAAVGAASLVAADQAIKMVELVATYQDMSTRLMSLSGSQVAYAENEQYLIDLADRHHKSMLTLGDSYARLMVLEDAGLMTKRESREILEGMSNAASALGADNVQLGQSMYGLAQGLSAGTLRAEELNQITEPLPGLLQKLDEASGQAAGGFRNLVNDGKVTSEMFRDTLIKALEEYSGAAEGTADNINAKWADMENARIKLAMALEEPISDALNPVLTAAAGVMDTVAENAGVLTGAFTLAATVVGVRSVQAIGANTAAWLGNTQAAVAAAAAEQRATKELAAKSTAAVVAAQEKVAADQRAAASALRLADADIVAAQAALSRAENSQRAAGLSAAYSAKIKAAAADVAKAEQAKNKVIKAGMDQVAESQRALTVAADKNVAALNSVTVATDHYRKSATLAGRAGKALSGVMGVFGGPWGLAVTAGITALTWAMGAQAEEASELRGELDELTGSVDSLNKAEARQALQNMESGFERAQEKAQKYKNEVDSLVKNLRMMTPDLAQMEGWQRQLVDARGNLSKANKKVDGLIARQEKLQAILNGTSAATVNLSDSAADQSKAFAKLAGSLNEQITALTLGAREQYEFKLAQEGVDGALKETLLSLWDYKAGLEDTAEAEKKKAAEAKAAEQAAKALAGQHQNALEALEAERIGLEKGAEAARIYRLEQAGFGDAQIAEQMEIWKKVEALKAEKKAREEADKAAEKEKADNKKAGADFNEGIEDFELTIDSIGDAWTRTGDRASEAIANMTKMYQEFAEESVNAADDQDEIDRLRLENQENLSKGLISQADHKKNAAKLDKAEAKLKEKDGQNQIALYHGLAGAMSSAFKQGSKEARAFQVVQQGLALYDGIRAVVNAWSAPYPTNLAMVPLTMANVASLLGQMGQTISGGSGASMPSMSADQLGFEAAKMDNESVVNRLDQQIELLEAIERNGSAAALNVDLAAAEYQAALYEWVEDVFDKSRMGFVDAMFTEESEQWAGIQGYYQGIGLDNPYEMQGDQIRIKSEQFYRDADSLIAVIQDIADMVPGEGYDYSGPFGQGLADEYGYGEGAHEAFLAAMRGSFTELQGHLNTWAVGAIESLTDLSDASQDMKDAFDSITGSSRYATEELNEAYAAFDRVSGGDYAGYLEQNIDAIAEAEGWLDQLSGAYDEHGNQLSNWQLLLSKDVDLFQEQAIAVEHLNDVLGETFAGGAEEALNFIKSIDLVAESLGKTRELEDRILELTDSEAYLVAMRERELGTLTDTQKALQQQIWAIEDEAKAESERQKAAEDAEKAQQKAYDDALRSQQQLTDALAGAANELSGFSRSISDWLSNLDATDAGLNTPGQQFSAAQTDFTAQLLLAEDGDRDAINGITQYADRYISSIKQMYGSGSSAQTLIGEIKDSLSELPEKISPEVFLAEEFRAALLEQAEYLQQIINSTQYSIDALIDFAVNDSDLSPEHQQILTANIANLQTTLDFVVGQELSPELEQIATAATNELTTTVWAILDSDADADAKTLALEANNNLVSNVRAVLASDLSEEAKQLALVTGNDLTTTVQAILSGESSDEAKSLALESTNSLAVAVQASLDSDASEEAIALALESTNSLTSTVNTVLDSNADADALTLALETTNELATSVSAFVGDDSSDDAKLLALASTNNLSSYVDAVIESGADPDAIDLALETANDLTSTVSAVLASDADDDAMQLALEATNYQVVTIQSVFSSNSDAEATELALSQGRDLVVSVGAVLDSSNLDATAKKILFNDLQSATKAVYLSAQLNGSISADEQQLLDTNAGTILKTIKLQASGGLSSQQKMALAASSSTITKKINVYGGSLTSSQQTILSALSGNTSTKFSASVTMSNTTWNKQFAAIAHETRMLGLRSANTSTGMRVSLSNTQSSTGLKKLGAAIGNGIKGSGLASQIATEMRKKGVGNNGKAYAKGGVFTNSIVNQATWFDESVMGEAGPEAIMPLKRLSGGDLGIKAQLPKRIDVAPVHAPSSRNLERLLENLSREVGQLRRENKALLERIERHEAAAVRVQAAGFERQIAATERGNKHLAKSASDSRLEAVR